MGVDPAWFYELCDPVKGEIPHSASDPMAFERDLSDEDATSATVLRLMQYHHLTEPAVETDGTKAEHHATTEQTGSKRLTSCLDLQVLCEDHVDNGLVTLSLITDNPSLEIHRIDGQFHMEALQTSPLRYHQLSLSELGYGRRRASPVRRLNASSG